MAIVYLLAQRRGRVDPIGLLLIGVMLNSINAAAITLISYLDPTSRADLMRWMMGYLDDPDATAEALRTHADGRTWLHTGDLGRMDEDGFVTFAARSKRMIKSSGFNVYPGQVEAVLEEHPAVAECCVIGVPDESQGQRVKAVVVVREPAAATDGLAAELVDHCRERLIKWSCPRDVEFRSELPLTKIGKVDFRALEAEAVSGIRSSAAPG